MSDIPHMPRATQAQIIRAHQKDLFNMFTLREGTENVIRAWLGTRWLSRWNPEVELLAKLAYYVLTTMRGTQTLGEEYVDIRPTSMVTKQPLAFRVRAALILLPTVPSYILTRFARHLPLSPGSPTSRARAIELLPSLLELFSEINLAVFYINGVYYGLAPRILTTRYMTSVPPNPNQKPPSYSLLGILLAIKLTYRLQTLVTSLLRSSDKTSPEALTSPPNNEDHASPNVPTASIDSTPVPTLVPPSLVTAASVDGEDGKDFWGDRTVLDVESLPDKTHASRRCALCLEERTASTVTECGHLFCWTCIVGWGREKAVCPLCRQSLALSRLVPLYNM